MLTRILDILLRAWAEDGDAFLGIICLTFIIPLGFVVVEVLK